MELDPTKAKGCDQLHKLYADSLVHPLHELFTASLGNGIYPSLRMEDSQDMPHP